MIILHESGRYPRSAVPASRPAASIGGPTRPDPPTPARQGSRGVAGRFAATPSRPAWSDRMRGKSLTPTSAGSAFVLPHLVRCWTTVTLGPW